MQPIKLQTKTIINQTTLKGLTLNNLKIRKTANTIVKIIMTH